MFTLGGGGVTGEGMGEEGCVAVGNVPVLDLGGDHMGMLAL